jgi:hypothetical protein
MATNVGITGTGTTFLDSGNNTKSGIQATPVAGTVTTGWMYLDGNGGGSGTATQRLSIYTNSSGHPATLLGSSDTVNVADAAAAAWVQFTFSTPVTIPDTNPIWLAVHWGNANARIGFTFPETPNAVFSDIDSDVFSDGSETPWNMSKSTLFNGLYAIYVEVATVASNVPSFFEGDPQTAGAEGDPQTAGFEGDPALPVGA